MKTVEIQRAKIDGLKSYLEGLRWDGVERLANWLIFAVEGNAESMSDWKKQYLRGVGQCWLMGMCARALQPSFHFPYMPVLVGLQGSRKSTLLSVLAADYFFDGQFRFDDKATLKGLAENWLYEITELDAMSKRDIAQLKSFITRGSDSYRAPFSKTNAEHARRALIVGTATGLPVFLKDDSRRFWPVPVTRVINTGLVQTMREQLFAEAMAKLEAGYLPLELKQLIKLYNASPEAG